MHGTTRRAVVLAALVALLVSSAGTAVAQDDDPEWEADVYDEFAEQVDQFNEQVGDANLGPAGDRLADRTINVYVSGDDETAAISMRMDGENRITEMRRDPDPDADLRMRTSRETMREIARSDRPAATFRSAYAGGDVSIGTNYSLGDAISGQRGDVVGNVADWGFWKTADAVKGLLG